MRVLSRRDFVVRTTMGIAGAALVTEAGLSQHAAPESRNQRETMRYRVLGRTNLLVSELSMGGQFLTSEVFTAALDKGVNLVHLAAEYPGCFDGAAPVLRERRDDVFIGTKGTVSGLGSTYIDGWLQALGTDHIDIGFVPTVSADDARDADGHIRAEFEALKQAGKVRFLGLTCHNNVAEVAQAALEAGHWDVIMARYGLPFREELQPILDQAAEKNVGAMGMKSFQAAGGRRRWAEALQSALGHPGLSTVLKGLPSHELLNELAAAVMTRPEEQARGLPDGEPRRAYATCLGCGRCAGCPQGIAIEEIMRCAFYYGSDLREWDYARQTYARIPAERTVLSCVGCSRCDDVCSAYLPVRHMLEEAHDMLV